MTRKRFDEHGTEFGSWIREVSELQSKDGFLATNLDYIWRNYKTGQWMLIEEKRYQSDMRPWQLQTFNAVRRAAETDKNYRGFVFLQFEKTSPVDGKIYWNKELITTEQLVERLAAFTHGAFLTVR